MSWNPALRNEWHLSFLTPSSPSSPSAWQFRVQADYLLLCKLIFLSRWVASGSSSSLGAHAALGCSIGVSKESGVAMATTTAASTTWIWRGWKEKNLRVNNFIYQPNTLKSFWERYIPQAICLKLVSITGSTNDSPDTKRVEASGWHQWPASLSLRSWRAEANIASFGAMRKDLSWLNQMHEMLPDAPPVSVGSLTFNMDLLLFFCWQVAGCLEHPPNHVQVSSRHGRFRFRGGLGMFSGMVPNGSCLHHAALAVGNSTRSSYFCSSPSKKSVLRSSSPAYPPVICWSYFHQSSAQPICHWHSLEPLWAGWTGWAGWAECHGGHGDNKVTPSYCSVKPMERKSHCGCELDKRKKKGEEKKDWKKVEDVSSNSVAPGLKKTRICGMYPTSFPATKLVPGCLLL